LDLVTKIDVLWFLLPAEEWKLYLRFVRIRYQIFYLIIQSFTFTRMYPKVSGLSRDEVYAFLWYYYIRSNKKGYGGNTHHTDSQNTQPHLVAELYHLQFSLQAASPDTFGYTHISICYNFIRLCPLLL